MADDHEGLDDDFDLDDELLAVVEQAEQRAKMGAIVADSDDEFEDLDSDDLIMATENAEKLHSSTRPMANIGTSIQKPLSSFFTPRSPPILANQQQEHQQQRQIKSLSNCAPAATSAASILMGGEDHATEAPPTPPPPLPHDTPCAHEFDPAALTTWIYPINYPVRLYQWNIVKQALFYNTLVALPTGLGKTFIAAVVMYNYWRWFPKGKVVFMAPTKPLVSQQIEACFNICGIPQSEMIEITGHVDRNKRKQFWESHRVFFMTPQTMQNDLESKICPAHMLTCIVVDEAHKATGSYAYGEVIRLISKDQKQFRVLALTATPGTNLQAVQTVVSKLHITKIQIRTEDSMDIQEHAYGKRVQNVLVGLEYTSGATGSIPEYIHRFKEGFFKPVLQRLSRFQAIQSIEVDRNSNYTLLQAQKHFTANCRNFNNAVKSMVAVDFSIAMAMARCYERLCFHGVGPFLDHLEEFLNDMRTTVESGKRLPKEKNSLLNNTSLKRFIEDIHQRQNQPGFVGHPKMEKMVNIVLQHLSDYGEDTRIMIFSTYRSSVDEIVRVLSEHKPMVRCSLFVGQAGRKDGRKGLNQREQQEIVTKFKQGRINVLVATSIGEEGLDIGEVDLIICYDSQSSPIRMLQRMGRTGRKRRGRCVMIMTEQEERKFKNAKASYAQVQNAIARGGTIEFFTPNPSVLPENYHPVWCKKALTIGTFLKPLAGKRKRQIRAVDANGHLTETAEEEFMMDLNVGSVDEAFENYWPTTTTVGGILSTSNRYLPRNTELMPTSRVGHSTLSKRFVQLVSLMEQMLLDAMVTGGNEGERQDRDADPASFGSPVFPSLNGRGTKWLGDQLILPGPRPKSNSNVPSFSTNSEQTSMDRSLHLSVEQPPLLTSVSRDGDGFVPAVSAGPSSASGNDMNAEGLDSADLDMLDDPFLLSTHQDDNHLSLPVAKSNHTQSPHPESNSMTFLEFDFDSQPRESQPPSTGPELPIVDDNAKLEFDSLIRKPGSPGNVSFSTTSTDFERILPPELSATTPVNDNEDDDVLKNGSSRLSTVRHSPQPTEMDRVSISQAMLHWLTSRPTFSKAAKLLLNERMDIIKVQSWIDEDDYRLHEQQQPQLPSSHSPDRSAPSFDEFDIDESLLASLENIPAKQLGAIGYLNATFNQVLENKVDENTSIAYTSIPQDDNQLQSPDTATARSSDHLRNKLDSPNAVRSTINVSSPSLQRSSSMPKALPPQSTSDFSFTMTALSPIRKRQDSKSSVITPLREDKLSIASTSSPSPVVFRRRKRITLTVEDEDDSRDGYCSSVDADHNNEDDRNNDTHAVTYDNRRGHIFLDLEAELSSGDENGNLIIDENGNRRYDDDDEDNGSDLSRYETSFIDDGSSGIAPHHDGIVDMDRQTAIYRNSLMSQQLDGNGGPVFSQGLRRRRTWLDRFEADKWLMPQEDDEVIDDSYTEEEDCMTEERSDEFV
ncbi:hypothetical protein BX666DRAFT_1968827 [Dichotomocladium elegans]|nr:hypothetical protein BX666DRAFT_1968827 [Dichotomocladium elegans]